MDEIKVFSGRRGRQERGKMATELEYDVRNIRDINPRMSDKEILMIAVSEKRLVITMDKDFGELIHHSGLAHSGVLLLRLEAAASEKKVEIVSNIMNKYSDRLIDSFSVFKDGRLRIRKTVPRKL